MRTLRFNSGVLTLFFSHVREISALNTPAPGRKGCVMFVLLLIPAVMFVSLFLALGLIATSHDSHASTESTEPAFELAA